MNNRRCSRRARAAFWRTKRQLRICASCATAATHRDSRAISGKNSPRWASPACSCRKSMAVSGLGNVEAGTIMEEIGRNLTPSPFLATAVVGVSALLRANGERKERASAENRGGRSSARARRRRARQARPAADRVVGDALRQRIFALRHEDVRRRWACRGSADRRRPHRRRARRNGRADALPCRSEVERVWTSNARSWSTTTMPRG